MPPGNSPPNAIAGPRIASAEPIAPGNFRSPSATTLPPAPRSRVDGGTGRGRLLRRHVRGRPPEACLAHLRCAGVAIGESEPEIRDPGSHSIPGVVSLAVQEDIGGLEVEVEHAAAVEVPDRAGGRL